MSKLRFAAVFLFTLGVAHAQNPSPGELGLVPNVPNVVQVLDSTNNWSTIGTINPTTHIFSPTNGGPPSANIAIGSTIVTGGTDGCLLDKNVNVLGCLNSAYLPANVVGGAFFGRDAVIAAGSNILASASRLCTSADYPPGGPTKRVIIAGAGLFSHLPAPGSWGTLPNPVLSQYIAANALGGRTYYAKLTYVDGSGETTPGPEFGPLSITNGNLAFLDPPPPVSGARGYNLYLSNTGAGNETLQNGATPLPFNRTWYEPATGLVAGVALPVTDTSDFAGPLRTTVTGCSGSSYALADNNQSTFSYTTTQKQYWAIGVDDGPALAAQAAANPNSAIVLPSGFILIDTQVPLSRVALMGQNVIAQLSTQYRGAVGLQEGSNLLITTDPAVHPFKVNWAVRMSGVAVSWPGQYAGDVGTFPSWLAGPVAYKSLFVDDGTNAIDTLQLDRDMIFNAFDLIEQTNAAQPIVTIKLSAMQPWCINSCFKASSVGQAITVAQTDFNGNNNPAQAGGVLKLWSGTNGAFIVGTSTGVPGGACGANLNFQMSNSEIHTFNSVMALFGINMVENNWTALDVGGQEMSHFMTMDPGSKIKMTLAGGTIQTFKGATTDPQIDIETQCTTGGGTGYITSSGVTWTAASSFLRLNGNQSYDFIISGGLINSGEAATGASSNIMDANNSSAVVNITGTHMFNAGGASSPYGGLSIKNISSLNATGDTFDSLYGALDTSAMVSGKVTLNSNNVIRTAGTTAFVLGAGQLGDTVRLVGNTVDKMPSFTFASLGACGVNNAWAGSYGITDATVAYSATAAAISAAGTGVVNTTCTYTLSGGTCPVPPSFSSATTPGAGLTGAQTLVDGGACSVKPTDPVTVIPKGGSGCDGANPLVGGSVNVTWAGGTGAPVWDSALFGGGTATVAAVCDGAAWRAQ